MWVNIRLKHPIRLAVLILLCFAGYDNPGWSQQDTDLWNKANAFYSHKQYDSALVYYNALLRDAPGNAFLHYNLGNTHYRLNNVGLSVLHYEKSLHFDPDNQQVRDNLKLAKARIQNPLPEITPIFFVRWWDNLLLLFSPNAWAWFTLLVFIVILATIYYRVTLKDKFTNSGRWLSAAIIVFILSSLMTWFTFDLADDSGKAVVLDPSATLVETPQLSGKVMNNIPEGTLLEVYGQQGSFLNVKLPNGRMGWVQSNLVAKV